MKAFVDFIRQGGMCPPGGKKVVIVGAFGYFGSALAPRLAKEHAVFTCGRLTKRNAVEAFLNCPLMPVLAYSAESLTAEHCAGADAIIHLAGGGASGGNMADPSAAIADNLDSARHIASIAPKGARLILASSIYVYGTGPRPFRETDTCAPDTLYGQFKRLAEAVWQQRGGTALRFAHIYGVGSGVDFGRDGVTERLARAAAGGPPFEMHGDGSQRIDLVHIDDACAAVALALKAPELPPAVNIGGGERAPIWELAQTFGVPVAEPEPYCATCAAKPGCPTLCERCLAVRFGPEPRRALDISLAATALGWAPRVTLAEGARGLVEMVKQRSTTK